MTTATGDNQIAVNKLLSLLLLLLFHQKLLAALRNMSLNFAYLNDTVNNNSTSKSNEIFY